jgi:hypothetical protein
MHRKTVAYHYEQHMKGSLYYTIILLNMKCKLWIGYITLIFNIILICFVGIFILLFDVFASQVASHPDLLVMVAWGGTLKTYPPTVVQTYL